MADQPNESPCTRCGKPHSPLDEPPFETDLGRRIQQSVCAPCWAAWMEYSVKLINEYRLNLFTEQGARIYDEELKTFLGIQEG
jgi:Fe-S cluster biosynthesis and repair protein YggX